MITQINPYISVNKYKKSSACCSRTSQVCFKANPDRFVKSNDKELYQAVSSVLKSLDKNKDKEIHEPFSNPDPQLVFEKLFLNINKVKNKFNLGVSYIYRDSDGSVPIAARVSEEELKDIMTSKSFKPTVVGKLQLASDDILYDVTHRFDD